VQIEFCEACVELGKGEHEYIECRM
jgi:hypothetical protein